VLGALVAVTRDLAAGGLGGLLGLPTFCVGASVDGPPDSPPPPLSSPPPLDAIANPIAPMPMTAATTMPTIVSRCLRAAAARCLASTASRSLRRCSFSSWRLDIGRTE
jgi:hypothetical protein